MDYNITSYGAKPEPGFDNRYCIQRAVDACAAEGGGRVVVPRGTFLSGEFRLASHVDLHIEQGAVLRASGESAAYPSRLTDERLCGFITAVRCEQVSITGSGVIDGDCTAWTSREDQYYLYKRNGEDNRPFLIMPIGCRHVTIRDVTIRNGPVWTVVPRGCDDVLIQGIRICNNLKMPNSDAIDVVSCRDVRIVGCHIEAGDDCICLKTYRDSAYDNPVCDGVVVTGCTLVSTSSALVIGCEVFGTIRNVVFNCCVIRGSNRGLSINLSKECDVENVIFSDMTIETRLFESKWWGHGEPVKISAIPWLEGDAIGRVRNVTVRNLYCRCENGVVVYGWKPGLIENILFDNVTLHIDRWSKWPGGEMDLRPTPQDGAAYSAGIVKQPISAFMIKNAGNVTLRNCRVTWGERAAASGQFRHAVAYDNAPGLTLEGFVGTAASGGCEAICEAEIRKPTGADEPC